MKNKEIIFSLLKIKNLLNEAGKKEIFFEHALTVSNFELLKIIGENKVETISELQKFLPDTLASLTQKTKKLEELEYLKKNKDEKDPRRNILKITKKGEEALKRVEIKIELVSSAIFMKFSKSEREKFLEILESLEEKLSKKIN